MLQFQIFMLAESGSGSLPTFWHGLMAFAVCLLLLLALVLFFASELVIENHWTIKKFRAKKKSMEAVLVNKPYRKDGNMHDLCFSLVNNHNDTQTDFGNHRIGQVMTIIYWKSKEVHELCKELRYYSGAFLFLFCVGIASNYDSVQGSFTKNGFYGIGLALTSYHVIPLLEVLMIMFLTIRFFGEISSIRNLLEDL